MLPALLFGLSALFSNQPKANFTTRCEDDTQPGTSHHTAICALLVLYTYMLGRKVTPQMTNMHKRVLGSHSFPLLLHLSCIVCPRPGYRVMREGNKQLEGKWDCFQGSLYSKSHSWAFVFGWSLDSVVFLSAVVYPRIWKRPNARHTAWCTLMFPALIWCWFPVASVHLSPAVSSSERVLHHLHTALPTATVGLSSLFLHRFY